MKCFKPVSRRDNSISFVETTGGTGRGVLFVWLPLSDAVPAL